MADSRVRAIAFPFQKGSQSFPDQSLDVKAIKESVVQIITTSRGERIMRPSFGCNAFDYVFESFNEDLQLRVERDVRQAITKWEPRVRVDAVQVVSSEVVEPGQITIRVQYTVLLTNQADSVVVAGSV